MAKLTKETFINSLKEMTMLEIKELVDGLKEEFGVDPSAALVAAAPATEEKTDEGPTKVDVVLEATGPNKIQVIKLIRDVSGLGLKEAKDIADNGGNIKEGLSSDEADKLKAQFEEVGATVQFK